MKALVKMVMVLAVVGAAMGAWLLVTGGDDVSLAKDATPPVGSPMAELPVIDPLGNSIFECYNLLGGDTHEKHARLVTDNFGGDVVVITQLFLMCEQATKTDETGEVHGVHDRPVVFACYRMLRGANPDDPVELHTQNFGQDDVDVLRAVAMCEGAKKTPLENPDLAIGEPGVHILEAYQIGRGDDPQTVVTLTTQNFREDLVRVRKAMVMMEEAMKETRNADGTIERIGKPTGRVWQCFKLDGGDDPQMRVSLETVNFPLDEVTVGAAIIMCEEARKVPIIEPRPIPTDLPDLIVTLMNAPTVVSCPTGGGSCSASYDFRVSNIGLGASPATSVLAEAEGVTSQNLAVVGLASGASVNMSVTLMPPPGDNCYNPNCTINVFVDSADSVAESDETNNKDTRIDMG